MQWFRFYSEALEDPKVQRLSPPLFKTWVNLLCLASKSDAAGVLPSPEDCAFALRMDFDTYVQHTTELLERGLVDAYDDHLALHNWEGRQKRSDNVTARVHKHREQKQQSETLQKRSGNGLEKNRVEEKREEETIYPPDPPPVGGGGAAAPHNIPTRLTARPSVLKPKEEPPSKRPPDLLFEAVCVACDIDWHKLTDSERGKVNAAVGQIRKAGGTPEDVPRHAEHYAQHFTTSLTPNALAGNWAKTANGPPARASPNGHAADPLEDHFGHTAAKSLRALERVMGRTNAS